MTRRGWRRFGAIATLGGALVATPALAQTQTPTPSRPAPAPGQAPGQTPAAPDDMSRTGTQRPDTVVLHPKDGETLSVRVPIQGQLIIGSLIPWAVTGGKGNHAFEVFYDVRGIEVQHIGNTGGTKASFILRLLDGRQITVNIRTARAKYKVGYAIIT
jgi:hypothetical protein